MGVLVWILIKIPLLIIALITGLYLLYVHNAYYVQAAECIACDKHENKYSVVFRYMTCDNNIIEQQEKTFEINSPREVGETYKVLVHKQLPTLVRRYDKVLYNAISIILISAILVITL